MLGNFFRINLPYGIAKNENGEWMAFNREYLPLGFIDLNLKGMPGKSYLDLPVYASYKKVSEKLLLSLADNPEDIQRNENGEIIRVFFYKDSSNPVNVFGKSRDEELWNRYFNKLKILSVLKHSNS